MLLYHGTDLKWADKIVSSGFICKRNKEHWLGNGIYFFQDKSLAEWWTTKPSTKFGAPITDRAIIECEVKEDHLNVLNLLSLEDYKLFYDKFVHVFLPLYCSKTTVKPSDWKQVRCAYCDFLHTMYHLDMIIGNFDKPDQPYLDFNTDDYFNLFLLNYTEVQVCIFNQSIITHKSVNII